MLYYFRKGKNATETQKEICAVYVESAVTDWMCQKWFGKFCAGDFSLDDAPRSGRRVEVDSNPIEVWLENNQCYTRWRTPDKSSTENSFAPAWLCQSIWHLGSTEVKQTKKHLLDCISACDYPLKSNENVPFLKQMRRGDEKWILHNNVESKRSWGKWNEPPSTTLKAGLFPKKVMLRI